MYTAEEGYRYMLDSFCRDSVDKINVLQHIMYHLKTEANFDKPGTNTITLLETILKTMMNSAISITGHYGSNTRPTKITLIYSGSMYLDHLFIYSAR